MSSTFKGSFDPHLTRFQFDVLRVLDEFGFDASNQTTTAASLNPFFLIALSCGDGIALEHLIRTYKPSRIDVALSDWHDIASSFWNVDWIELQNFILSYGGKLVIGYYEDSRNLLSTLSGENFLGLDHSILFYPPAFREKHLDFISTLSCHEFGQIIKYLGFTLDEYNMIANAWQSMTSSPRIFSQSNEKVGGRFIVVGSGPSLDNDLDAIRELSSYFTIIASASSFRTLRSADIRVDILVLLERSTDKHPIEPVYKEVVDEFGITNTFLFASSTSPSKLYKYFEDVMVFHRPALTPYSMFATNSKEILWNESPQSTNPSLSFCCSLKADTVILAGCDFGTASLDKDRSSNAAAYTDRNYTKTLKGNLRDTVHSEQLFVDGIAAMERCITATPETTFYNISDGAFIEGAIPIKSQDFLHNILEPDSISQNQEWKVWWTRQPHTQKTDILSKWESRRPRSNILNLCDELRSLYCSGYQWKTVIQPRVWSLMDLEVSKSEQFPRRIVRSTILKAHVLINRLLDIHEPNYSPDSKFLQSLLQYLVSLVDVMEAEMLCLCDYLDSTIEN